MHISEFLRGGGKCGSGNGERSKPDMKHKMNAFTEERVCFRIREILFGSDPNFVGYFSALEGDGNDVQSPTEGLLNRCPLSEERIE